MKKFGLVLLIFFSFFATRLASAHGDDTSLSQQVGDYKAEFEYNTKGTILAGDFVTFDVHLMDKTDNEVPIDNAYIKIAKDTGQPVLVGTLIPDPSDKGTARLSGIIKDAGNYDATVQFVKSGNTIGPVKYNFTVDPAAPTAPAKKNFSATEYLFGGAGLILGIILGIILRRPKNTNV